MDQHELVISSYDVTDVNDNHHDAQQYDDVYFPQKDQKSLNRRREMLNHKS